MDFPIVDLIDDELAESWLLQHFHPDGLNCPHCGTGMNEARHFRQTEASQLAVYRCRSCQGIYNLYSGTVLQGKQLRPAQAVLLLRGVCQGQPSAQIAREVGVSRQTVMSIRREIQSNAEQIQPTTALSDQYTETDELYQNAGEKKRPSYRPNRSPKTKSQQAKRAWHLRERPPTGGRYDWSGEWSSSFTSGAP